MNCCSPGNGLWVPRWFGFTDYVPTVPQLYWNVDGNEQRYHLLCKQLHKLVCYADMLGMKIEVTHEDVKRLQDEFEKFKESGFLDYYEKQIEAWINANMPEIIGKYIRMVFFGLTLDGYFVAYIPEGSAWDDIIFDTGAIYAADNYGRLILYYATDSTSDVWQENSMSATSEEFNTLKRMIESNSVSIGKNAANITTNTNSIEQLETDVTTNTNLIDRLNEEVFTPLASDESEG